MQKSQIYIIFFLPIIVKIFHHDRWNLHDGSNTKLLQVLLRFRRNDLYFLLLTSDNLPQTRPCLCLLFWVKVFENVQKNIFYFFIGLAVHYVVPVGVFYLLFTYLGIGLSNTFLQLKEVFIKLFAHRVIAYWIYHTLQHPESLGALMQWVNVLDIESIYST